MTIQEAEDAIGPLIFHKLRQISVANTANSHLWQYVRYFVTHLHPHKEAYDKLIRAINKAYNSNNWDGFSKWFNSDVDWESRDEF